MKITFLGAAQTVTGSCYVIETTSSRFAVDCGMFQGNSAIEARNFETENYRPDELDFILLTHAPGEDMVPCTDLAHKGFRTFNRLLEKYQPALFFHGHTHLNYGRGILREQMYGKTRVINSYERCLVEL